MARQVRPLRSDVISSPKIETRLEEVPEVRDSSPDEGLWRSGFQGRHVRHQ